MTSFLDSYGEQLSRAGSALASAHGVRHKSRRRWRLRRPAGLVIVGVLIAAPALAATQPWEPLLGRPALHDTPTVSADGPPEDQLAALSVLRRPQTTDDQGAATQDLLQNLGVEADGVRTSSVRLLDPTASTAVVLVSVLHIVDSPGDTSSASGTTGPVSTNQLCLLVEHHATCGGLDMLLAGHIVAFDDKGDALGLVPDGVTRVVLDYRGGPSITADVDDNFFNVEGAPTTQPQAESPGAPPPPQTMVLPSSVQWLDSSGHVVGPTAKG